MFHTNILILWLCFGAQSTNITWYKYHGFELRHQRTGFLKLASRGSDFIEISASYESI